MDLPDLNHDQRLALVALIEATVQADRRASDQETDALADITAELGDAEYQRIAIEADGRFKGENDLRQFLAALPGQEARELIYGTVLDLAMADVVSGHESELLQWLAQTWQVEASFDSPEQ
jgi:uncharacterized tellurite resistance protein B-like protein